MSNTEEQLGTRSDLANWLSGTLAGSGGQILPGPERDSSDQLLSAAGRRVQACRPAEDQRERIESERVRLFVNAPGGVPAAPYGSWWTEGTIQGKTTTQVADFYLQEGLRIEKHSGPADYLPTELEFLSSLLHHQRAALLTDAHDLERQSRGREREFLEKHLLPWIPRFCLAGRLATQEPFWKAVLDLLEGLIESEAVRVRGQV